jgi:hypothetical protein
MFEPVVLATWISLCIPWADPTVAAALATAGSNAHPYLVAEANGATTRADSLREGIERLRDKNDGTAELYIGLTQLPASRLRAFGIPLEVALEPCANLTLGWQFWEEAHAYARTRQGTPMKAISLAFSWYRTRQEILDTPYSKQATDLILSFRPVSPAPFGSRTYLEIAAAAANGRAQLQRLESPGSALGSALALAGQARLGAF